MAAIDPSGMAGVFRGACHTIITDRQPSGAPRPLGEGMRLGCAISTISSLLHGGSHTTVTATEGFEISPGSGVTVFAEDQARDYWLAILDRWRRRNDAGDTTEAVATYGSMITRESPNRYDDSGGALTRGFAAGCPKSLN
jgi:hypothetical protein